MLLGSIVRLIGGPVEHMGRVEVFDRASNQWGTICFNDIRYQYYLVQIICRSLGYFNSYANGYASGFPNVASSSNSPIVTGYIYCHSTDMSSYVYQNLYHCSNFESHLGIANSSRCTSDQEWVLVCNRKFL